MGKECWRLRKWAARLNILGKPENTADALSWEGPKCAPLTKATRSLLVRAIDTPENVRGGDSLKGGTDGGRHWGCRSRPTGNRG